jgi:hypothetical protein
VAWQHHGCKESIDLLVAMHFATVRLQDYDVDGVICVDFCEDKSAAAENLRTLLQEEGSNAQSITNKWQARHEYDGCHPTSLLFLNPLAG